VLTWASCSGLKRQQDSATFLHQRAISKAFDDHVGDAARRTRTAMLVDTHNAASRPPGPRYVALGGQGLQPEAAVRAVG
jgi:hypothetical protein